MARDEKKIQTVTDEDMKWWESESLDKHIVVGELLVPFTCFMFAITVSYLLLLDY